jgi:hypothetical protein
MHDAFGLHCPGGEQLIREAGRTGWLVFTEAIGSDQLDRSGKDFQPWARDGIQAIVRLNNGYHPGGTIPCSNEYAQFAARCGNYVAASQGASRWIIGNETNYAIERPGGEQGEVITPQLYARCFRACREGIKAAGAHHQVLVGAVAPWNNQTQYPGNEVGDWVVYLADILRELNYECDGVAVHTYTHGADPSLITSEAKMDPPFSHRRYNFRAYIDFCRVIPPDLPVYITETDEDVAWLDQNIGWVQAAYAEIDRWNQANRPFIHCLALYRWPVIDKWYIEGKNGVINDFKQALSSERNQELGPSLAYPVPPDTPVSQHFGENEAYYSQLPGYIVPLKGHNGIDFACPVDTEIYATDDGVITRARCDEWGFGLMIMIRHEWGESLYAHLNQVCMGVEQRVTKGQKIAYSGKSGNVTGPHLHFGIKLNDYNSADGWGGYSNPWPLFQLNHRVLMPLVGGK